MEPNLVLDRPLRMVRRCLLLVALPPATDAGLSPATDAGLLLTTDAGSRATDAGLLPATDAGLLRDTRLGIACVPFFVNRMARSAKFTADAKHSVIADGVVCGTLQQRILANLDLGDLRG